MKNKTVQKIIDTFVSLTGAVIGMYGTTGRRTGQFYDVPYISERIMSEYDQANNCIYYLYLADVLTKNTYYKAKDALENEYKKAFDTLYRAAGWIE